jgi:hypothetical protein
MRQEDINEMSFNTLIITICFVVAVTTARAQDMAADLGNSDIPENVQRKIRENVERDILLHRAKLCPDFNYEKNATVYDDTGVELYQRGIQDVLLKGRGIEIPLGYKMIMEIDRWPEDSPYLNHYLIRIKGMQFTNGIDTINVDVFNKYYNHDGRYLVYYQPDSTPPWFGFYKNISGAFFQSRIDEDWFGEPGYITASKLVYKRLAQYDASPPSPFPIDKYETEDYYQFKVDRSLLAPNALLVRVPKRYPYDVIEVIYYTNDTTATNGEINSLYEVKYKFNFYPKTYNETLPQITRLGVGPESWSVLDNKIKTDHNGWSAFIHAVDIPPTIKNEEYRIDGKIDSVYLDSGDYTICVIDNKGRISKFVGVENDTRYTVKGKGKKWAVVEKNKIAYKED